MAPGSAAPQAPEEASCQPVAAFRAAPASTGLAYSSFLGDAGQGRAAYAPETYARLVVLKNEYDRATSSG